MNTKIRLKFALWALTAMLAVVAGAFGQTVLYVSEDGHDDTGQGSAQFPWQTIGKALDMAAPTDQSPVTIRISGGTYAENITLKAYLTLEGGFVYPGWARDIAANPTIITDAAPGTASRLVVMADATVLDGLTLQGGYFGARAEGVGATLRDCVFIENTISGISAFQGSDVFIESCRIERAGTGINVAHASVVDIRDSEFIQCSQFGLFADNGDVTITDTLFSGQGQNGIYVKNSTLSLVRSSCIRSFLNGLRIQNSSGQLINCIFGYNGTGILAQSCTDLVMYHNTISGNRVNGLFCDDSTPDLRNNIFSDNIDWGLAESAGTVGPIRLTTNCFSGNASGDYLDAGTTPTLGAAAINSTVDNGPGLVADNIDGDPMVHLPADDSYYLGIGSSCLDAAEELAGMTEDVYNQLRPFDFPGVDNNGPAPEVDIGAVEFSGIPRFDFPRGETGWVHSTVPFFFNESEGSWLPERLSIKSNDTLTFGFWTSPFERLPAMQGLIYRIEFDIATDVVNRDNVPTFRLRALNGNGKIAYTFGINSASGGTASPVFGEPMTYVLYFTPLQGGLAQETLDQIVLSFDILQFDPNDQLVSTFFIDSVRVTALDKTTFINSFTETASFDFTTGDQGWQVFPPFPLPITQPDTFADARGLNMRAQDNLFCYGTWHGQAITPADTKAFYVRATMGCDVADPALAPTFRLRLNTLNNQAFGLLSVNSVSDGSASPSAGRTLEYEFFLEAPAIAMDSGIFPFLDLLNFDPNDAPTPTIWLESMDIHALSR